MFDLDRAIAEWRTAFERDAAFARHEIDELEAHLRDSVAERIAAGERPSEAFDAVRDSLGTPSVLRADFVQFGEWSKGWPRLLRTVGSAGFVLYVGFMLGYNLFASLYGPDAFWDGYADGPWAPVVAVSFVMLNLGIYLGFAVLLIHQSRTLVQRVGASLSVAGLGLALCFHVQAGSWIGSFSSIYDPHGITGALGSLTFVTLTNGLTLLGLMAIIIWNRERTWLRRALMAFGVFLMYGQTQVLWQAWLKTSPNGSDWTTSPFVIMLVAAVAHVLLALLAWSRWVRRPAAPELA
ncbi:MAG: permease prefix domain 1-containing protein [Bacteroidota bacterium]